MVLLQVAGVGQDIFRLLQQWGFLDFVLPFLLIFALVFAILNKVRLFEERSINGTIAFVVGVMSIIPHFTGVAPNLDPVLLINEFLRSTSIILLAILCVILLLGLAGGQIPSLVLWIVVIFALLFLGYNIIYAVFPSYAPNFNFIKDPATQALAIILFVMGLVVYFVVRDPTAGRKSPGQWFGEVVNNWFGAPPTGGTPP